MKGTFIRYWFLFLGGMIFIFTTVLNKKIQAEAIPIASFLWAHEDIMRTGKNEQGLFVQLMAREGEGEYRLALRVLRDGSYHFNQFRAYLGEKGFQGNEYLTLPLESLNASIQAEALNALFPKDQFGPGGLHHHVVYEWESLDLLRNVFLIDKVSIEQLVESHAQQNIHKIQPRVIPSPDSLLERRTVVILPWDWIRKDLNLRPIPLKEPLYVVRDRTGRRFASYTILQGESLYSDVVLRFTDYLNHDQVQRAIGDLMLLNQLQNVRDISSGTTIRIPLEWISMNYRHGIPGIHNQLAPPKLHKTPTSLKNYETKCEKYDSCKKSPELKMFFLAGLQISS